MTQLNYDEIVERMAEAMVAYGYCQYPEEYAKAALAALQDALPEPVTEIKGNGSVIIFQPSNAGMLYQQLKNLGKEPK